MRFVLCVLAAVALHGCTKTCTDEARAGIQVRLTDMAGGAALAGATVKAIDGTYVETLMDSAGTYTGAYERTGTYTVTVELSGYTPMTIEPVEVKKDDCHVITRSIDVMLTHT
ncbi:MAG TPA: carboxypeptidase regulatory-like domain-containing protein [Kofleriaceae bacterium]|jgi:hypothetical protein|nr:carboxypeptidase regulatory-like domain-containing protein [Kofleriaceae bacterium]